MERHVTRRVGTLEGTGQVYRDNTKIAVVSYNIIEFKDFIVFPDQELEGIGSRSGTVSVISGDLGFMDRRKLYLNIKSKGFLEFIIKNQSFGTNASELITIVCSGDFLPILPVSS